jgi:serine/threonine protein kinase
MSSTSRLWSRAAQGPDMPLVLNICMDITAGMNYIHDLDIIHGGLGGKPPLRLLRFMSCFLHRENFLHDFLLCTGDLKLDNILLRNTGKGVVAKVRHGKV